MVPKTVILLCSILMCGRAELPSGYGVSTSFQGLRSTYFDVVHGVGVDVEPDACSSEVSSPNTLCFTIPGQATKLNISNLDTGVANVVCQEVTWNNPDSRIEDCISLGRASWYGGSEMRYQRWPIAEMQLDRVPYVTGDFMHNPLGGINDNIWFNSDGFSLFVDRNTPLFIRFNRTGDGNFCLSSSYDEYPYQGASATQRMNKELKYTICSAENIKEVFQFAMGRYIDKPTGVVDPEVIAKPIWSTWARFPREINSTVVVDFANEIVENGFTASHFEIDDMWEPCYGELVFDNKKFPNMADTTKQIKKLGFKVSLWIHPYVNTDCPSYSDPTVRSFLIQKKDSNVPLNCSWWNGVGGYLDSTNEAARNHFISKLTDLKTNAGIDSFKFDSGEVDYIADGFVLTDPTVMATINSFTKDYVTMASLLGNGVEVRVGFDSQSLPIFVRMLDKDSKWDFDNGLKTLIPTALHMSIIGFPYVLPDMIGGNNYGTNGLPEKELFIRWLQINVFMPALQFSIVPWDYDHEVINITKAMVEIHNQYAPLINQLADEAVRTGNPIVRPLWWIAPTDSTALVQEQQFLLGDDILVAPVVEKGAVSRDIYLPSGNWQDNLLTNISYTGPTWLKNYSARLDQLPYFTRIK